MTAGAPRCVTDPLREVQELFQVHAGSAAAGGGVDVGAPNGGGDFGFKEKLVAALGEPGVMSQVHAHPSPPQPDLAPPPSRTKKRRIIVTPLAPFFSIIISARGC